MNHNLQANTQMKSLKSLSDKRWHCPYGAVRVIDINYGALHQLLVTLDEDEVEQPET